MDEVQAVVEFVQFDPANTDTYPSVCSTAQDVENRFGFVGGEILVFTTEGAYLGKLEKMLETVDQIMARGGVG